MSLAPDHRYSLQEYLDLEADALVRHEYYQGKIYAMAGGTPEHAAMSAVITALLGEQLKGQSCQVYSSDLRLRVLATGLATYPDVTVICGPSKRDPESYNHVTNPTMIVEVLSPGTAEYDRGEKLQHYQQIPSLQAILLVDHEHTKIERWQRKNSSWERTKFGAGSVIALPCLECSLAIDAVYAAAKNA